MTAVYILFLQLLSLDQSCTACCCAVLQIGERYQEVFSALVIMVATQHAAAGMLATQLDNQRAQAAKQVCVGACAWCRVVHPWSGAWNSGLQRRVPVICEVIPPVARHIAGGLGV
jgi:hypothetical protein